MKKLIQKLVNTLFEDSLFADLYDDDEQESPWFDVQSQEIKEWLDKYRVKNYTINPDLTIDVDGEVSIVNSVEDKTDLSGEQYTKAFKQLPDYIRFNHVKSFNFVDPICESLEGMPKIVDETFRVCQCDSLQHLYGSPEKVERYCIDSCDALVDFDGMTQDLNTINIETSGFTSTKGIPKHLEEFRIIRCQEIENLEITGVKRTQIHGCKKLKTITFNSDQEVSSISVRECPRLQKINNAPEYMYYIGINGSYDLETLEGFPKRVSNLEIENVNIESLEGGPTECEDTYKITLCSNLKSLKGSPTTTKKFICTNCKELHTFEGCPKKCYSFDGTGCGVYFLAMNGVVVDDVCDIRRCTRLTTLEDGPKCGCLLQPKLKAIKGPDEKRYELYKKGVRYFGKK